MPSIKTQLNLVKEVIGCQIMIIEYLVVVPVCQLTSVVISINQIQM